MRFRVIPISARTTVGLAKKLEEEMNSSVARGAQITSIEQQAKGGYLIFTVEAELPVFLRAQPAPAPEVEMLAPEGSAFLQLLGNIISAETKAEYVRELPGALARAVKQLPPGEIHKVNHSLATFVTVHRKEGCKGCRLSDTAELVHGQLKKLLAATLS